MFNVSGRPFRLLAILGAIAFIASTLQYAVAQILVASAWNPAYSWTTNFISDLGNTACGQFAVHGATTYVCSPRHDLMNASFMIGGLLTIAGTLLLWRAWPARRLTNVALVLWLIAGVLKVVVGLAPENTIASLHLLGAFNLPLQSIAICLLSVVILGREQALALFGLIVGVIGLAASTLSTVAQSAGPVWNLGLGNGGMERLAGYPGNLWMLVLGAVLLAQAARHGSRDLSLPRATAGSLAT